MIATLDDDGRLIVVEGDDRLVIGRRRGRDERARKLGATRQLRQSGYTDLGPWRRDEAGQPWRRVTPPPPRPKVDVPPSAPDPDVPAPAVGDVVMPREGLVWCGRPVRVEPHEVVNVHDYRPEGLAECVVVIQDVASTTYLRRHGFGVNAEHGAYVGLVDVTPVPPR